MCLHSSILTPSGFGGLGNVKHFDLSCATFPSGDVRVYYEEVQGNITVLQSDQRLALSGEDFVSGRRSIVIGDGEDVGSIPVWVKDDEIPELGEVFLVNITEVELVNPSLWNNTIPPSLGHHHVSEISLLPNDDPHGVFRFPNER